MTTITLTADPAGDPAPFINVDAVSFPGGVATTTAWRTVQGRSFKVRGLVGVSTGGTVSTRDFEAPIGVESSYRFEHFDSFGEFVSWSSPQVATLTGDTTHVWIHNPLDPSTSIRVRMQNTAVPVLSRPIPAEVLRPLGRSLGVAYFGTRAGVGKIQLDCWTETQADADAFDALFGGYDDTATVPILCIRTPPAMRLPPTLFALITDPQQVPFNFRNGGEFTSWVLQGDEISPPPEAIVVTLLGYDDFTAFYADYAAFTAAYADYRTATLDYSIAGTA